MFSGKVYTKSRPHSCTVDVRSDPKLSVPDVLLCSESMLMISHLKTGTALNFNSPLDTGRNSFDKLWTLIEIDFLQRHQL